MADCINHTIPFPQASSDIVGITLWLCIVAAWFLEAGGFGFRRNDWLWYVPKDQQPEPTEEEQHLVNSAQLLMQQFSVDYLETCTYKWKPLRLESRELQDTIFFQELSRNTHSLLCVTYALAVLALFTEFTTNDFLQLKSGISSIIF